MTPFLQSHAATGLLSTVLCVDNIVCRFMLFACVQAVKMLTDNASMVFSNPLYAIFLAFCPWHPRAQAVKAAKICLEAVSHL